MEHVVRSLELTGPTVLVGIVSAALVGPSAIQFSFLVQPTSVLVAKDVNGIDGIRLLNDTVAVPVMHVGVVVAAHVTLCHGIALFIVVLPRR